MTITHTPGPWHWTASCPDGTMTTDDDDDLDNALDVIRAATGADQ